MKAVLVVGLAATLTCILLTACNSAPEPPDYAIPRARYLPVSMGEAVDIARAEYLVRGVETDTGKIEVSDSHEMWIVSYVPLKERHQIPSGYGSVWVYKATAKTLYIGDE
jgi:hypothetical protein